MPGVIETVQKSSRVKLVLIVIFSLIVSVVGGAGIWVYFALTGSMPQVDGELALSGLEKPVEVTFDSLGIPQIWAESEHDGYFALGYQHAADRLFQMEIARRVSHGTLSEMLGSLALEVDIKGRIAGHTKLARIALENLSEDDRSRLEAYVSGINSSLETNSLPFEFLLLMKEVAPWSVEDCLALLSFQSWFSDALQNRDEFFLKVAEELGEEKARTLLLPFPDWAPYTVPPKETHGFDLVDPQEGQSDASGVSVGRLSSVFDVVVSGAEHGSDVEGLRKSIAQSLLADNGAGLSMCFGSNGWVVSGAKTVSGKPILAGDPHLDVTRLPQFWYIAGLHIAETDEHSVGITSAGLPFVVMGANGRAAWTMTAAGIDQTDYFAERVNPDDSMQYLTPDGWREFVVTSETINVADTSEPIVIDIKHTGNGPVVLEDDSLEFVYSLRWSGSDMDLAVGAHAALSMSRAENFSEFRESVTNLAALNSNWLYADTSGDIGYQLGAPIPVRAEGSENLAHKGWEAVSSWQGYHGLHETPWALNPEQGWLANCNNKQDQANLDYTLQGTFFADRILRVSEQLDAENNYDLAKTKALQTEWVDQYFLRWRDESADLLDSVGEDSRASEMRQWDGVAARDSKQTALVAEFILQLKKQMFDDELGDLTNSMKRLWVDQVYHSEHEFWFDDVTTEDKVENRNEIAQSAIKKAVAAVGDSLWGDIHSLTVAHPFSFIAGVGPGLGLKRGPFSRGGSGGTINASYYREIESGVYQTLAAPSWRFVIDLADPEVMYMCAPAGNSGNPLSDHFFDFYPLWEKGQYWKVSLNRTATFSEAKSILKLQPES